VSYLYGDDLISQTRAANDSYYLYDGLGSVRALSNSVGAVTDTYNYSAYGQLIDSTGTTDNSYRYTGEQYDPSLNNYYLRARYYDPGVGRFTSMDAWEGISSQPDTLNKYNYSASNPVNNIDPSGNSFLAAEMSGIEIQSNLQTVVRSSSAKIAKEQFRRFLIGSPPSKGRKGEIGFIGEKILDWTLQSVREELGLGERYPNKGSFGTAAHNRLKNKCQSFTPLPNIEILCEPYVNKKGRAKVGTTPRKGSIGVDILVKMNRKPVLAIDLKTGRGYPKKGILLRKKRFGTNIIQIFLKVPGK